MKQYLSIIAFIISLFFIKGCTESISYSGKILNYNEDFYHSLNSKKEVEIKLGQPSFVDLIEKNTIILQKKELLRIFLTVIFLKENYLFFILILTIQ